MVRVVFDTNILFSAAFKRVGIPAQLFELVVLGIITPCISPALMEEYLDVLTRPVLQAHAARSAEVLELMAKFSVSVSPTQTITLCSDPDDNRFVECAAEANAQYLVTGNLRHYPKEHPFAFSILPPRELLRLLVK